MALWGNLDASNNAPNFSGITGYKSSTSLANSQIDGIFGNTTIGQTRSGVVMGVFGVDSTEANSALSSGNGRNVTHAGWVVRTVGTGPVTSISANAGAVGTNSFVTFTGGSSGAAAGMTGNTSANAIVAVNTAGYITSVTLTSGGSYANTPVATPTSGNAAFTLTMGGRANRVQQETLVAMGSMTGDATAAEDSNYPDS
jgi:hypothetical protein